MLKTSSSVKVRMVPASKKGWSLRAQEELLHLLTEAEQQEEGTYCVYIYYYVNLHFLSRKFRKQR